MSGRLVLIVGPSGAGKDSLLRYASAKLQSHDDVQFPRRIITRKADETETHLQVSTDEFRALRDSGGLAFHWQAHGLYYGLPASITHAIATGHQVVVNVSRRIVDELRSAYPCLVIEVTAPLEILSQRLTARGREAEADIEQRLQRASDSKNLQADAVIVNDSSIIEAGERLVALILIRGNASGAI